MSKAENQARCRKKKTDKGLCCQCGKEKIFKAKRCETCYNKVVDTTRKTRKERCDKGLCTNCGDFPHEDGKKRCSACLKKQNDWYENSNYREENRKKDIIRRRKRKQKIFKHYGTKCACCNLEQYEFLCIDHIEGGGNEHRRSLEMSKSRCGSSSTNFYKWLEKNNYPEGFQTLCHNCNMAKSIYGVCPHQQKGNE